MATSDDDATSVSNLDASIPPDDAFVYKLGAEIRLVKDLVATDLASISGPLTATHTEINTLCDGATTTAAEVNALAGSTIVSADVAKLVGITVEALDVNARVLKRNSTVKVSNFNASANNLYLVDTSGGWFTCTLPAGSDGIGVGVVDVSGDCDSTKYLRIAPQAGEKVFGVVGNTLNIDRSYGSVTLMYTTTYGWTFA